MISCVIEYLVTFCFIAIIFPFGKGRKLKSFGNCIVSVIFGVVTINEINIYWDKELPLVMTPKTVYFSRNISAWKGFVVKFCIHCLLVPVMDTLWGLWIYFLLVISLPNFHFSFCLSLGPASFHFFSYFSPIIISFLVCSRKQLVTIFIESMQLQLL